MNLILNLDIISTYCIAFPIFIGVLYLFRLTNSTKIFFSYIVFNTLIQLGLKLLASNSINNVWLVNVSALSDVLFCLFFINSFYLKYSVKKIIITSIFLTLFFGLINTLLGWSNIVKFTFIASELLSLILVLAGFLHLTKEKKSIPSFYFWILIPLSLYFSVSILVFLAIDLGIENNNQNLFVFYDYLYPIVNILAYCSYAVAFYLDARPKLNPRH